MDAVRRGGVRPWMVIIVYVVCYCLLFMLFVSGGWVGYPLSVIRYPLLYPLSVIRYCIRYPLLYSLFVIRYPLLYPLSVIRYPLLYPLSVIRYPLSVIRFEREIKSQRQSDTNTGEGRRLGIFSVKRANEASDGSYSGLRLTRNISGLYPSSFRVVSVFVPCSLRFRFV